MKSFPLFLLLLLGANCMGRTFKSGDILLQDPLDGTKVDGWKVAPTMFVDLADHGTVYKLETGSSEFYPEIGDSSWAAYRVEFETMRVKDLRGFVGIQFHIQSDNVHCNNLSFFNGGDISLPRAFESAGHWNETNMSWKLWPYSQKYFYFQENEWTRICMDIGESVANVFVGDSLVYTTYDLPFGYGGLRFWEYHVTSYLRNFKITALNNDDVIPLLPDPWQATESNVIREWMVSPLLDFAAGIDSIPPALKRMNWGKNKADRRGILNISAAFPENQQKKVVLAKTTIVSDKDCQEKLYFAYTDRMNLWCNGIMVFKGDSRGWNDPGRGPEDGFGRVLPDLFETSVSLKVGENEILIGLEINEPQFGAGLWMRRE